MWERVMSTKREASRSDGRDSSEDRKVSDQGRRGRKSDEETNGVWSIWCKIVKK